MKRISQYQQYQCKQREKIRTNKPKAHEQVENFNITIKVKEIRFYSQSESYDQADWN